MNATALLSLSGSWLVDAPWWFTSLAKISLVLAVTWLLHWVLVRANPRWRVVLWRAAVIGLMAVVGIDASRLGSFAVPLDIPASRSESVAVEPPFLAVTAVAQPSAAESLFGIKNSPRPFGQAPFQDSAVLQKSVVLDGIDKSESMSMAVSEASSVATIAMPGWFWLLVTVWGTGVLIGGLGFVIGRHRLARVVAASRDVPQSVAELAARISSSMGTVAGVVRSSTQVRSPMVCRTSGIHTLLVPDSLVASSSQAELAAILTHEFAHLRSHDLVWNGLIRLLATLLWPHPLAWRVSAAHVTACEYAADAESARWLGDPAIYVQTLAKVALGAAKTPALPGLAMARVSDVRNRLSRVTETFRLPPLSRRHVLVSIMLMACATIGLGLLQVVQAQPPQAAATSTDETTEKPDSHASGRMITVRVVDVDNNAIENSTLTASVFVKDVHYDSREAAQVEAISLGDGRFQVPVADDASAVQLKASAANRVPMKADWQGDEVANDLPKEFTFTLPPGTKISGRVVDEQATPIANASVYLLVITDKSTRQQVDLYRHLVKTDETGEWVCDLMPSKFNGVWIRLTHPDFASDSMFGETAGQVSVDDVRSGTHTMVMKRGSTVQGTIVDEHGDPVAGAKVYQGSDRFGSSFPETKTDEAGRFSFPHSKPGEMVLTVVAKGFAPELKVVQVDEQTEPILITLAPGKTLRIRTVGADDKPLADVMIAPDRWRGHRSLADVDMPRSSNDEGVFVWNDAPADEIQYSILKREWMDQRNAPLKPQEAEIVVKLLRPLVVTGNVTDATTGKPIEHFSVVPGIKWEQGETITWVRQDSISGRDGEYLLRFTFPRPAHLFQVEATGYEPMQSRLIQSNEGELSIDFELKPAKQITGIVMTPSGEPAAGADVVMTNVPNQHVGIFNGRMQDHRDQPFVIADAEGKFTMASQKEPFKLMAMHDSGVSLISGDEMQEGQTIQLKEWAKITGIVKIGSNPAAQTELHLWYKDPTPYNEPRFSVSGRARADTEGRFEFARVLPDAVFQVSRIMASGDGQREGYTHGVNVNTHSGRTEQIAIGGSGRPVVGRVIVPESTSKYVWAFATLSPNRDDFEKPDGYEGWTNEERTSWYQEWSETEAGKAYNELANRRYAISPDGDGSFRIEDVPAGRYDVRVSITAALENKQCGFGEQLGSVQEIITVPEMDGGRSDEPLDIGELTIKLRKFLNVGDTAPSLTAVTFDGTPVSLADLSGKYVLLDFWATWCGPCLAELPNLEKAQAALGDREDFVILALNMDAKRDAAQKYLDEHPHGWLQAYIEPDRVADLLDNFGILGIPATFLIGPDGKVLAKDLRGEPLVNQVKELLP